MKTKYVVVEPYNKIWISEFEKIKAELELLLRPLKLSDLKSIHEYASDKENTMYMYHLPRKIEETAEFLSSVTKEWEKKHRHKKRLQ